MFPGVWGLPKAAPMDPAVVAARMTRQEFVNSWVRRLCFCDVCAAFWTGENVWGTDAPYENVVWLSEHCESREDD